VFFYRKKKKKVEPVKEASKSSLASHSSHKNEPVEQQDIDAAIEAKMRDRNNPLANKTKAELRFLRMQDRTVSYLSS